MVLKILFIVSIIFLCVKCIVKSQKEEFSLILQEQVTQCGPICLQMIAKHYGLNTGLNQLEVLTKMDYTGTSMLNLSHAADSLGFKSIAAKISFEELLQVPLPAIVHWNNNHFLVVYKINETSVWVADPKTGKKIYNRKEFCDNWLNSPLATTEKGVALLFEKNENKSN